MRSCAKARLVFGAWLAVAGHAAGPEVFVASPEPAPWLRIFSAAGIRATATPGEWGPAEWRQKTAAGAWLVLEGDSPAARAFGFLPSGKTVKIRSVKDVLDPEMEIVWERAVESAVFRTPEGARVFAAERWSGAPLVAGLQNGAGGVLWTAVSPGVRGYERFPFLLHALAELGMKPPFRSRRLWAFFDSSYRLRADLDYLAQRWRKAGIRGLHIAAWHHFEPEPARDAYLTRLIESCHRQGILAYLWLELPHVSEKFWEEHPEWREKTALGADAHLDWRKLMNLADPECQRAVANGVRSLVERFDWDGINLAELYFESLQGYENPSRFTPMNATVRAEFRRAAGFDPAELFDAGSARHLSRNPTGLRKFLDFRSDLARRIEEQWMAELKALRSRAPHLDLVLTHVDDRLDSGMKDAIGVDSKALLPLARRYGFTALIEDPATVWHLGPERYGLLAERYRTPEATGTPLAADINIAERYQDVYPTKRAAGVEILQLVNQASRAFPRVALYFEHAIHPRDVLWVSSAAAAVTRAEERTGELWMDSPHGAAVRWSGPVTLDGRLWPAADGEFVWVPAGFHRLRAASKPPAVRVLDFSGELKNALALPDGIELTYASEARAFAIVDKRPENVWIDQAPAQPRVLENGHGWTVVLPPGRRTLRLETGP